MPQIIWSETIFDLWASSKVKCRQALLTRKKKDLVAPTVEINFTGVQYEMKSSIHNIW